jgi:5-methylcytosine-specific restriction endonuclease McrA
LKNSDKSSKKSVSKKTRRNAKYSPRLATAREVFRKNGYKGEDNLSFEEFLKLSQLPCFYCGETCSTSANKFKCIKKGSRTSASDYAKKAGTFKYNGLDRMDNAKGHSLDNVVPCCKTCNLSKGSMSQEEFIVFIAKVASHLVNAGLLII